jgi:DNA-binding XRE family transcriptional regulator
MSGHRPFSELVRKHADDPERAARVAATYQAIVNAQNLYDLRKRRGKTQVCVAKAMGVGQKRISIIEHAGNLEYDTLRDYIAALGGRIEIRAIFPDEEPVTFTLPTYD